MKVMTGCYQNLIFANLVEQKFTKSNQNKQFHVYKANFSAHREHFEQKLSET